MNGTPLKRTETHAIVPVGFEGLVDDWHASPAVVSGDHIFLYGFNGCPLNGTPSADAKQQIETAFEKVTTVLRAAGLDWGNVVDMTSFHVGLPSHFPAFRAVRDRHVQPPYPAWTAVEVAGLAILGAIVELKIVARLPGAAS